MTALVPVGVNGLFCLAWGLLIHFSFLVSLKATTYMEAFHGSRRKAIRTVVPDPFSMERLPPSWVAR